MISKLVSFLQPIFLIFFDQNSMRIHLWFSFINRIIQNFRSLNFIDSSQSFLFLCIWLHHSNSKLFVMSHSKFCSNLLKLFFKSIPLVIVLTHFLNCRRAFFQVHFLYSFLDVVILFYVFQYFHLIFNCFHSILLRRFKNSSIIKRIHSCLRIYFILTLLLFFINSISR